jgi:hypothetical protein
MLSMATRFHPFEPQPLLGRLLGLALPAWTYIGALLHQFCSPGRQLGLHSEHQPGPMPPG